MHARTFAPLLLASLLLVGAGCDKKASQPRQEAPKPVAQKDACGNPYYPFKAGLTITYGISNSNGGETPDYTMTVADVSGTTATVRSTLSSGVTAEVKADCASGTVEMDGNVDLGSMLGGAKVKTEILSSSGTFMPANVLAGAKWESAMSVKSEVTEGPGAGKGPVTTDVATRSMALGEEAVTVAAGTYQAMKVEQTRTVTVHLDAMMAGLNLPAGVNIPEPKPTVTTTTEWWVKGIGLVKSVTAAGGTTTTVEAKSVSGN